MKPAAQSTATTTTTVEEERGEADVLKRRLMLAKRDPRIIERNFVDVLKCSLSN
jgi:hypothetical protein